jgi:hypothetical protein
MGGKAQDGGGDSAASVECVWIIERRRGEYAEEDSRVRAREMLKDGRDLGAKSFEVTGSGGWKSAAGQPLVDDLGGDARVYENLSGVTSFGFGGAAAGGSFGGPVA